MRSAPGSPFPQHPREPCMHSQPTLRPVKKWSGTVTDASIPGLPIDPSLTLTLLTSLRSLAMAQPRLLRRAEVGHTLTLTERLRLKPGLQCLQATQTSSFPGQRRRLPPLFLGWLVLSASLPDLPQPLEKPWYSISG